WHSICLFGHFLPLICSPLSLICIYIVAVFVARCRCLIDLYAGSSKGPSSQRLFVSLSDSQNVNNSFTL
uniref:Uncharacterized protein n=1 Tax=Poecilia mexicana TaxID=48701 RepID=A0A3B3XRW7_9TELE